MGNKSWAEGQILEGWETERIEKRRDEEEWMAKSVEYEG